MASDTNVTLQNGSDANVLISMGIAASANGIALAQAVGAAGNLVLAGALVAGGVYKGTAYVAGPGNCTFYSARRMVCVSDSAGDNAQTVTWTGTDRYGNALVEAVTLNGVTPVTTVNDFATVTRIAVSAVCAGNISAGTSAKASSAWIPIERIHNCPISLAVLGQIVSGAVTWGIEHTYDDPNQPTVAGDFNAPPVPFPPQTVNGLQVGDAAPAAAFADATITAKATTFEGTVVVPFAAIRFTITAGQGVLKGQVRAALMAA